MVIKFPLVMKFACHNRRNSLALIGVVLLLPLFASAKTFTIPPLPVSPQADTEISTNIVFNNHRSDVKELELKFVLECSSSNCIQVAFGNDANADGVLSRRETVSIYGWRKWPLFCGRCHVWQKI